MVVANSNEKAKPLLAGVRDCVRPPLLSIDGFAIRPNTNKIPKDLNINSWSNWTTIQIPVMDFYINMRDVSWKGQVLTVEYDLFTGLVAQMIEGDTSVMPQFRKRKSKEEVLDLIFEMGV